MVSEGAGRVHVNAHAWPQAVGASGAASIRPSLARSVKKGPQAVRRAALSAAQEQKLILCTSLLKEVWELHASSVETGRCDGQCSWPRPDAMLPAKGGVGTVCPPRLATIRELMHMVGCFWARGVSVL